MSGIKVASWIIIVFLALSYVGVFYLARNPEVSSLYRAYYIDRSTTISSGEYKNIRPYIAGTPVSYEGSGSLLFDGWSRPGKKQHRWSKMKRAQLIFVPSDPGSFYGTIVLDAYYFGTQLVEVAVNGVDVGSFEGDRVKTRNVLSFDPQLLEADQLNEIQFYFPDARVPTNGDSRMLAMALIGVIIQ